MRHSAEFLRCLVECDVVGARRLWHHVAPNMPQPKNDEEALITIHLARVQIDSLPEQARQYSAAWLSEREIGRVAHAVGIAVGWPSGSKEPRRREKALNTRMVMENAVSDAIKAGVDLATESTEIKRRMMAARARA